MCSCTRKYAIFGLTLAILGGAVAGYYGLFDANGASSASASPTRDEPANPVATAERSWPIFGGSIYRNMVNSTDKNVPIEWETRKGQEKKNVLWSAKLGSRAYGGPTVADGKVFVGTNNGSPRNPRDTDPKRLNPATKKPTPLDKGVLMCFRLADGAFLWQQVNDKLPSGLVHDWPEEGVCSTPIVEGNRLWYVSNRCEVVCLDTEGMANGNQGVQDEVYKDPTDADVIWRFDMMKQLGVFPHNMSDCSPLIIGDVLYITTANGVDEGHINIPSPNAPSFIALNKKTGELIWKDNSPGNQIMHGQWSNPAYAEIGGVPQIIFPGGDGWLRGFEPKLGKVIWKFDCNPKTSKYELGGKGTRSDFVATPVVYDGRVYIGVGQDPEHYTGVGHLWCIDPKGKSGDISSEIVTEDNADFAKRKTAPNPNSGMVWHFGGPNSDPNAAQEFFFGRTMSTCAIHDDLLFVAEISGFVHCLDAKTGKQYWEQDLKSEIWGSTYWVDGKIYIGDSDGDVYVFEASKEKKQLAKIEMEEPIRSTPVVANGVLYIMTETNLYAIGKK
jgi:outer membrane protein assembly factor BamB